MPQNITLVLTPRQAADAKYYTSLAARRLGMPEQDIALVRVVKRSIDARQRQPKVNLSLEVYADREPRPAPHLMKEIELLAKTKPWDWIITFHPKLTDPDIIAGYKRIAAENDNVTFFEGPDKMPLLQRADAMLCDSSSIILEFMFLDKPVVTFRNSHPGPHLIDVDRPEKVGPALERALSRPEELMREIRAYTMHHEPHRDCRCSARVLDAVDDYIARGHAGLKRKPLNLIRKWKLRRQMRYYPLLEMFRR